LQRLGLRVGALLVSFSNWESKNKRRAPSSNSIPVMLLTNALTSFTVVSMQVGSTFFKAAITL
jgi:hypothetical protein